MVWTVVVQAAPVARADVKVAFIARSWAEADPVPVVVGVRLVDADNPDLGRRISKVGIRSAYCVARDVCNALAKGSISATGPGNVEVAVGGIVGVKRHPHDARALTLPNLEGNIEKRGGIN